MMKTRKGKTIVAVVTLAAIGISLVAIGVGHHTVSASASTKMDTQGTSAETVKKQVPVVLTTATQMTFENRIEVSGTVNAKRYALVSARIPGTLDAVYLDEGDEVQAGETKLFQTDSLKLTKAVAIAKQDLAVAEASVQEKQALLTRGLAGRNQALNDLNRYRELLKRNAVAAQLAEQQETQLQQCDADVKHTQALIELATAQLEQTRLNLTIAEKDLADSLVVAPISGRVSERLREPGEMAGAGTPVLRIEDLSVLEISVFLPEEYYASVLPGQTKMRIRVGNVDLGERLVSYKSPTVNNKLRTFKVEGLVESPPPGVVPGCLAEVTIVTDSHEGAGIPSGAVQTRAAKSVAFAVEGDAAHMVTVTTGRQSGGWIEILDGLSPGTPVITMGQTLVEEGTPISVVEEEAK